MELSLLLTLIFILAPCSFIQTPTEAKLLYGCLYDNFLCEDEESCIEDGFFGRCQTEPYNLRRYNDLSEAELELLRLELARLASLGQSWGSDLTQCVIGYYFMTRKEHFQFDPDFCNVREPGNILQLIQMAENAADKMSVEEDVEREIPNELPVYSDSSDPYYVYEAQQSNPDYEFVSGAEGEREIGEERGPVYRVVAAGPYTGDSESIHEDVGENYLDRDTLMANVINQLIQSMGQSDDGQNMVERGLYSREAEKDNEAMGDSKEVFYRLTEEEEGMLNRMLLQVMNGENPDLSQLSDKQLDKFITYVELMQSLLEKEDDGNTVGEIAFPQQEQDPDAERYLLKKDEEQIGNVDLGLENREHKIVKGIGHQAPVQHSVEKIDGNRVHIKTAKECHETLVEFDPEITNISKDYGRLMELVNYLKEKIAKPKNLKFSDFRIDHNEISFTVNRNGAKTGQISEKWLKHVFGVVSKRITPGLQAAAAIANNKRTLDKLVGHSKVSVGSKRGDADFEKAAADDGIVVPTLVICGLIVGVLVSLLGVYVYRNRNRARSTLKRLAADVEGQPTKAYEELCRQRMAAKGESSEPLGGVVNTFTQRLGSQSESPPPGQVKGSPRTSSTSSWSEEPVHITNMDISTGHVILSYLEDHLENKDKLDEDWQALNSYRPDHCDTLVAQLPEHSGKNRSDKVLPYDHARVQLKSEAGESPSEYINASPLYDHDPKNPVYIVTQGPLMSTAPEFWQMIWEQGSVVIVNLTKLVEEGMNVCHRYWPENGSEVYGVFEVHLVSEHIWCEDYLVRSFYLKNLRTNETRTVTQFHFLSWREAKAPISPKSLLEFRRKVNKSYRGRSCPIVVHCSDGSGRSGTYCLLDMVLNRINKGVKEIDIAATLEHLRDQRMGLAATKGQYEFVLMCVAEEVQAIIKALPQQ